MPTWEELLRGVDESLIAAKVILAKFEFIHYELNAGVEPNEMVTCIALKHFFSDVYSAIDRMTLVLHCASKYPGGLDPADDVRSVQWWSSSSLFKPALAEQGNAAQLENTNNTSARNAAMNILGFVAADEADVTKAATLSYVQRILLELQTFRTKDASGAVIGLVPFTSDRNDTDQFGQVRAFAYLHYLRNLTTHRMSVIPAQSEGYVWIDPQSNDRQVRSFPSLDANVESVRVARGLWIRLPKDPRALAGATFVMPLNNLLVRVLDVAESLRHNLLRNALQKILRNQHYELPARPNVVYNSMSTSHAVRIGDEVFTVSTSL